MVRRFQLRLGIPALELTQTTVHVEDNDAFLVRLQMRGQSTACEGAESSDHRSGACCKRAQKLSTSEAMCRCVARIFKFHRNLPFDQFVAEFVRIPCDPNVQKS